MEGRGERKESNVISIIIIMITPIIIIPDASSDIAVIIEA